MVADIIDESLYLAVLFQLGDIQSLWSFLALRSPCRLDSEVELPDNHDLSSSTLHMCHSKILSVVSPHFDIVNELPVFGTIMHP